MVLVFISPMNLFTFLLAIYAFFAHILVCFCSVEWFEFLYILAVNPLSDTLFTNIFFQSIGCLFVITFYSAETFWLDLAPFIFAFVACAFGVLSINSLTRPISRILSPVFY